MRRVVFDKLLRDTRAKYRKELGVALTFKTVTYKDYFKPLTLSTLENWRRYYDLAIRKKWTTRTRIAFLVVPPTSDDYSFGITNGICSEYGSYPDGTRGVANTAIAGVQEFNRAGQSRYCYALTAAAHEIGHAFGANHTDSRYGDSVMDPDAGRISCNGVKVVFKPVSKREIRYCLRGKYGEL